MQYTGHRHTDANDAQRLLVLALKACLLIACSPLTAAPLWHSESLSLLYGDGYRVAPSEQSTLTLEHASGWAWGDLFGFLDTSYYPDSSEEIGLYGELTPRLSLSALTGQRWSAGLVTDVLVAATVEAGRGDVETLLIGPGFSLDVPGFEFVNINVQYRMPYQGRDGALWQWSPSWSLRRSIGQTEWVFDGYIDWVPTTAGDYSDNVHVNPQLKFDLGHLIGAQKGALYVGIEYDYWANKFGIRDTAEFRSDQNTISIMVQYKQ